MTDPDPPSIPRKTGRRPLLELLAENRQHPLRRARLQAARSYGVGSVPRRACLGGYYDAGSIVQRFA